MVTNLAVILLNKRLLPHVLHNPAFFWTIWPPGTSSRPDAEALLQTAIFFSPVPFDRGNCDETQIEKKNRVCASVCVCVWEGGGRVGRKHQTNWHQTRMICKMKCSFDDVSGAGKHSAPGTLLSLTKKERNKIRGPHWFVCVCFFLHLANKKIEIVSVSSFSIWYYVTSRKQQHGLLTGNTREQMVCVGSSAVHQHTLHFIFFCSDAPSFAPFTALLPYKTLLSLQRISYITAVSSPEPQKSWS